MSTTPKKKVLQNSSSCRLCQAIVDRNHCRNIFHKKNLFFLSAAEEIFGGPLAELERFSNLLCRPCERRLTNFKSFQQVIRQSQASVEMRFKRVIEISPSAPVTIKSSKRANQVNYSSSAPTGSARRGLNFPATNQLVAPVQRQDVSLEKCIILWSCCFVVMDLYPFKREKSFRPTKRIPLNIRAISAKIIYKKILIAR